MKSVKYKLYLIIFSIFILSGCTINYKINFKDNIIEEEISGKINNDLLVRDYYEEIDGNIDYESVDESFLDYFEYPQCSILDCTDQYYKLKTNKNDVYTNFNFSYNYNYEDFINSNVINSCFSDFNFYSSDGFSKIEINGPFRCDYMTLDNNSINIEINSKYNIKCNGKKEKSKCIYNINDKNKDNIKINIEIDKKKKSLFSILDYIIILLVLFSVVIFYLFKKKQLSNK